FKRLKLGKTAFEKFSWSVGPLRKICSGGEEWDRLWGCHAHSVSPGPIFLEPDFDSYPQIGPNTGMVGGQKRWIVRARLVETNLACDDLDALGDPNVVDAAVHPRPVRMGDLAFPAGERREGSRRGLGLAKSGRHQPGRMGIESGVE